MEKNKKTYTILASIIIASFLIGNIVTKAAVPGDSNLLEDVWNYIFGIEEEVEELSDNVLVIESNLDLLERIHELEIRIAVLEECGGDCDSSGEPGFPAPDYDSGWRQLTPSATGSEDLVIVHNLGTLEYMVYFMVTEDEPADATPFTPSSYHNFGTGGAFIEDYIIEVMTDAGTYWKATANTIVIHRYPDDVGSNYGRVLIWVIQ